MKLFAPKYYTKFKCIADKCSHSCCIGWEIDIDSRSYERYSDLQSPFGKELLDSIDMDEVPHFRLCENERCPHLDKSGLCRIISLLGEDYLCDICREHPRFYNDTPMGKEVGLGMACEEACRIILSSDEYDSMVEIEEIDQSTDTFDFDALPIRANIFECLSNSTLSYSARLETIYNTYGVSPYSIKDKNWLELIDSLEYLNPKHKELFMLYSSSTCATPQLENCLKRALAYFVYRHCTQAYDCEELLASIGFCLFAERLLCVLAKHLNNCELAARIISEELEYSEKNTEMIKNMFFE